jgi:formylmethanofuran dehydrogenase subunit C
MLAGSVFVAGRLGERPGAGMKRGTIVGFGEAPELLPTFRYACTYRPVFMQLLPARADRRGADPRDELGRAFRRYVGDMNDRRQGGGAAP